MHACGAFELVEFPSFRCAPLEATGIPGAGPVGPSPAILLGRSTLSALVAAWLPARKAATVDPVDILRGAA